MHPIKELSWTEFGDEHAQMRARFNRGELNSLTVTYELPNPGLTRMSIEAVEMGGAVTMLEAYKERA